MRILALAGGGYPGLYTVAVLAELEARGGEPLARRFDLIADTSIGGIAALALAFEVPMARVVRLFATRGTEVFSPRARPRSTVNRLLDLSRSVLGPKYSGSRLRELFARDFGRRTLGQALHRVVIPRTASAAATSTSLRHGRATPASASTGHAGSGRDTERRRY